MSFSVIKRTRDRLRDNHFLGLSPVERECPIESWLLCFPRQLLVLIAYTKVFHCYSLGSWISVVGGGRLAEAFYGV